MNEKTLRITIGPVILSHHLYGYSANWHDPIEGNISHPIDPKWTKWLEEHFSLGILAGFGFAFILPEMIQGCPKWETKVNQLSEEYCKRI